MGALREVIREKSVTLHPPPAALYAQASAFRFPALHATALASHEPVELSESGLFASHEWTLLGCAGSQFAQPMVDAWVEGTPPLAAAKADGGGGGGELVQARWLSFVDGAVLGWLQRPLLATMRLSVPRERHAHFLCRFGDSSEPRRKMQMQNKYLGFVCLVDRGGVVRWHVHGNEVPAPEELERLAALVVRARGRRGARNFAFRDRSR